MKRRMLSLLLALVLVLGMLPVSAFAAETDSSVTVYVSVMDKGNFVAPAATGSAVALEEVTVPYFDLAEYGLECLYYNPDCYAGGNKQSQVAGTQETADGVVTMLHLLIWITEVYYNNLSEAQAGQGWLAGEGNWNGFEVYEKNPGSAFINMWNFGYNLNYYLNYEYPLAYIGWGSTCDQIPLADGDIVSIRYNAATGNDGAYYHFGPDGDLSKTTSQSNDVVLTMYQCTESLDYTTGHQRVGAGETVYVNAAPEIDDNAAVYTTNADGQVTIETSELDPGTYYVFSGTWDPAVMYLEVTADAHTHTYTTTVVEPTCVDDGYTLNSCSCGYSYESDLVEATGHDFVDGYCTVCECPEEEEEITYGDINGDGTVNNIDAAMVYAYHNGKRDFTAYVKMVADVSGDGTVNNIDAALIYAYHNGKITTFPCEK